MVVSFSPISSIHFFPYLMHQPMLCIPLPSTFQGLSLMNISFFSYVLSIGSEYITWCSLTHVKQIRRKLPQFYVSLIFLLYFRGKVLERLYLYPNYSFETAFTEITILFQASWEGQPPLSHKTVLVTIISQGNGDLLSLQP